MSDPRDLVDRGWRDIAAIDAALARGEIDDDGWHAAVAGLVGPAYLAADTPWGQSGKGREWEASRRPLLRALRGDGSFLDVGCANGYLLETLVAWGAEAGIALEPYGVDIVPALVELARRRLPQWADRFAVANARRWRPERRFDYVRATLDQVPPGRQPDYVAHLLEHVVAARGRLIIGVQNELRDETPVADQLTAWGFAVAGGLEVAHPDERAVRTAVWIDAG